MLKSHIAGQPHRIRQSSPRASISLRTAAQRRSRSASEGVGYSTSLRMALYPRRSRAEVERMPSLPVPPARIVIAGLDPAIHPSSQRLSRKEDGCAGHKRVHARLRRASARATPLLWVRAFAGMSGKGALTWTEFALVGGPRALAQDVPELGLERGERFHQRGGIELPRDAGRQLVCGVIGKMSPVCLPIQHRAAPSQLAMQDRSAAVKVGLRMIGGARSGVACCGCATHSVFPPPATRGEDRALRLELNEIGG